jgi:hypothetical protein
LNHDALDAFMVIITNHLLYGKKLMAS